MGVMATVQFTLGANAILPADFETVSKSFPLAGLLHETSYGRKVGTGFRSYKD